MRYIATMKKRRISLWRRFIAFDERMEREHPRLYGLFTFVIGSISIAVSFILILLIYAIVNF